MEVIMNTKKIQLSVHSDFHKNDRGNDICNLDLVKDMCLHWDMGFVYKCQLWFDKVCLKDRDKFY